jgi:hypothetical protein
MLLNSHTYTDSTTDLQLFEDYQKIIMTRHDILHFLTLQCLGSKWEYEKRICDHFNLHMPDEIGHKTPDIVMERKGDWYMIDVSISRDIVKLEVDKNKKYLPVVAFLQSYNYKITFIHINCLYDLSNLNVELEKLNKIKTEEFDILLMSRCVDIINDKLENIHKLIDKEKFDDYKRNYFNKKEITIEDSIYMDELKYVNIGVYSDIETDLNAFQEYNKKYDTIIDIEENYKSHNEDVLLSYLENILENKNHPIYCGYSDAKLSKKQFDAAFNHTLLKNKSDEYKRDKPKPTHHILMPFKGDYVYCNDEQKAIETFHRDFISDFSSLDVNQKTIGADYVYCLSKEIIWALTKSADAEFNKNLFYERKDSTPKENFKELKKKSNLYKYFKKTGKVTTRLLQDANLSIDKDNKAEIEKVIKDIENDKDMQRFIAKENYSKRDYFRENNLIKEEDDVTHFLENKIAKIADKNFNPNAAAFYKKTGIKFNLAEPVEASSRTTIDLDNVTDIDSFLNILTARGEPADDKLTKYIQDPNNLGFDSDYVNILKKECINNYTTIFNILTSTAAYDYSRLLHVAYKQLYHAMFLDSKPKTHYIFNCGIENMIIIVALTYNNKQFDDGKPFMCVLKTKNPELYNGVFGNIQKIKCKDYWYIHTNWRRLKMAKITFMRDSFFSTIATTMNSVLSAPDPTNYLVSQVLVHTYSLRVLVSYASNQRIGELLVDARYAYMSAIAVYTNIEKLLIEKFSPPFKTLLEGWIVLRLLKKLPTIHEEVINNGIIPTPIEMDYNKRNIATIGGKIKLPSLWGNHFQTDITQLIDEVFLYVHTMKEPSNIFHENIKALKTIIQFQNEFNELSRNEQRGICKSQKDIDNLLMRKTKIGCWSSVIIDSVKYTLSKDKPFFKKIISGINDESIGELLSTKAVIADIDRSIKKEDKVQKRDIQKKMRRLAKNNQDVTEKEKVDVVQYYLKTNSKFYEKRKPRQKVMETILSILEDDKTIERTINLANRHILKDKGRVVADICIKSQYGSKREFYVINVGAKALARVCENFFKELCVLAPSEAISVPGDKKSLKYAEYVGSYLL